MHGLILHIIPLFLLGVHSLAPARELMSEDHSPFAGMTLQRALFLMDPHNSQEQKIIRARSAVPHETAGMVRLEEVDFTVSSAGSSYSMRAAVADCHIPRQVIRTVGSFHIRGGGLALSGKNLLGDAASLVFQTNAHLEIRPDHIQYCGSGVFRRSDAGKMDFSFDEAAVTDAPIYPVKPTEPLRMVQDFSGNLATFFRCWKLLPSGCVHPKGEECALPALISPAGGKVDFRNQTLETAGASALLAEGAVLTTSHGLRLYREVWEDESALRMTAEGGVSGWLEGDGSKESTIRADRFDFVSDSSLLQFAGGPVVLESNGVLLKATEEWQFLRIFPNGRIVISTGSWTTENAMTD